MSSRGSGGGVDPAMAALLIAARRCSESGDGFNNGENGAGRVSQR